MSKIKPIKNGSYKVAQRYSEILKQVRHGLEVRPEHFKKPLEPAEFVNGKSVYIVQCRKLIFSYCEFGGSSFQTSYYLTLF